MSRADKTCTEKKKNKNRKTFSPFSSCETSLISCPIDHKHHIPLRPVLTLSCLKKHSILSSLKTLLQETRFWKTLGIFFKATLRPSRGSVTDLRDIRKHGEFRRTVSFRKVFSVRTQAGLVTSFNSRGHLIMNISSELCCSVTYCKNNCSRRFISN